MVEVDWVERKVQVGSAQGLHARPARLVWEKARGFICDIRIQKGEVEVDGKSIFDIMTLDANKGAELLVRAKGDQAAEAVGALVDLISSDMDKIESGPMQKS